ISERSAATSTSVLSINLNPQDGPSQALSAHPEEPLSEVEMASRRILRDGAFAKLNLLLRMSGYNDHSVFSAPTAAAAVSPERMAPSIVAGNPVCVQSPARNRLEQAVLAPGRRWSCSGVAAKVARFSMTICQGGSSSDRPCTIATSRQIRAARA